MARDVVAHGARLGEELFEAWEEDGVFDFVVVGEHAAEDAAVVEEWAGGVRRGLDEEGVVEDAVEGADEDVVDLGHVAGGVEAGMCPGDVGGDAGRVDGGDERVVLVDVGWCGD